MTKLISLVVVTALLIGVGWCRAADDAEEKVIQKEKARLVGTWKVVACEASGEKVPEEILRGEVVRWVITPDMIIMKVEDQIKDEDRYALDPTKKPKTIDLTEKKGKQVLGIYVLEGDSLKVCWQEDGMDRPTEFVTKPKSGHALFVFQREKR